MTYKEKEIQFNKFCAKQSCQTCKWLGTQTEIYSCFSKWLDELENIPKSYCKGVLKSPDEIVKGATSITFDKDLVLTKDNPDIGKLVDVTFPEYCYDNVKKDYSAIPKGTIVELFTKFGSYIGVFEVSDVNDISIRFRDNSSFTIDSINIKNIIKWDKK